MQVAEKHMRFGWLVIVEVVKVHLAKTVEKMLIEEQYWVKCLDGDNMRSTINSDLDLSVKSRIENIRRSAEISKNVFGKWNKYN